MLNPNRPKNKVKQLLAAGKIPVGIECMLAGEALVEMVGWAGFDFVHLDMEHTSHGFDMIERQVRAAENVGITPFVRVATNDPKDISRVLEAGAQGIVIPQVSSADDMRRAIDSVFYAPRGMRGMCPVTRAARYSDSIWNEYTQWVEDEVLIVPLIESKEGMDNLEEICALPEVHIVGLGGGDLGQSLGVGATGMSAPIVQEAFAEMIRVAKKHGVTVDGMPVVAPDRKTEVQHLINSGVGMITYDADAFIFMRQCEEIRNDIAAALND